MFRDTLQLPVETPKNLFVTPANIHNIEAFMNIVGYQGVVNKVSAFFSKNLAQPWQTMFKVFNRCLTTRTSGHDQTKINILQLFHAVINQTHVDYAALLWIEEDYHYIKDDVPLIRETDDFKEYETVFMKVSIPMNEPKPVVSTQGTNRNTPRAHRSPTVSAKPLEMMKRKHTAGESSSPRRIIKKKTQPTPLILPPGDGRERDAIAEATLLSADVDDTRIKIEPGSQKVNLECVSDDDETEKEKEVEQDMKGKETEEIEKEQNIVEKEVKNETNVEAERLLMCPGSQEIRNEQK
ncbi:hypothetical protein Tco_0882461 [Tanacetum coccineum]